MLSSRASILTGQYPHRVGVGHMVTDMGHPGYRGRLSDNAVTLAEVLKLADYRTFMSGKWHVGTNDPTRHGFEQYFGTLISAATYWDSRAIPASATGKHDAKLRQGRLLWHRRADRLRAGFSRGRPHDAGSAVVPLPGVQCAAFPPACAPGGHLQVPGQVYGRLGSLARRAPGANETTAPGCAKYPIAAALEIHQFRRDRQRRKPALGQPSG